MKKVLLLVLSFLVGTSIVWGESVTGNDSASFNGRRKAVLVKCQSKGTAWFKMDNEIIRTHLIAVDLEDGDLNKEIDEYICAKLQNGHNIELEIDVASFKADSYNRHFAWIYIDGNLLQNDLVANGYGQVGNLDKSYLPLYSLCQSQKVAIKNHLGIWNYEGIKEKYCKSGIQIQNTVKKEEESKETTKKYNRDHLTYLVFLNAGVTLLAVLILQNRRI